MCRTQIHKITSVNKAKCICSAQSERFNYLARRHVNGIDGGQHGVVSTALRHFAISSDRTFHTLSVKHMIRKHIPSSMNKYNFTAVRYPVDAQQLLRMARHETSPKPSIAYQHTALLTLPDRNKLPMEALSRLSFILQAAHAL